MSDLADIARCVASTDVSEEGSIEFLLACMQDLQEVLQHSKLKALVIDTFGGRIENLLRYLIFKERILIISNTTYIWHKIFSHICNINLQGKVYSCL